MTDRPLYVSFLWHMHQPFYKVPGTSLYRLPWVRLHGTKDYLDMVDTLAEFPDIKQNYNLTPSLLEQLLDYTENNAKRHLSWLQKKKPRYLKTFFLPTGIL
jgi:alpha-amylase/alpha-mannosidase (GH57 family)